MSKENEYDELFNKIIKALELNDTYSHENYLSEHNKLMDMNNINNTTYDYKLDINFVNKSSNPDPEYATSGSAGFDLRAYLSEPLTLEPGERRLIPTGLFFDLPNSLELQVRARSGLALNHGITVLNGIGTIDSDYTGEVGVILINHGDSTFIINNGDRIAQGVIMQTTTNITKLNKVNEITKNTERNSGGFGSTGIK
jgi:dUTP pyrophosphatase